MWHNIEEFIGDDCGFHRVGQVKIAENEKEMLELENRVKSVEEEGFSHEELIRNNELRELVPAISQDCVGGIVCRDDGAANPMKTTRAFWRRAVEEKAIYHLGEEVYFTSQFISKLLPPPIFPLMVRRRIRDAQMGRSQAVRQRVLIP